MASPRTPSSAGTCPRRLGQRPALTAASDVSAAGELGGGVTGTFLTWAKPIGARLRAQMRTGGASVLSPGRKLGGRVVHRGIERCSFREQCIDKELGRPIWILQWRVAAVDRQGALDAAEVVFSVRGHILRCGNVTEQTQPRIEISLIATESVKFEEYDCQLGVTCQALMAGEKLPVLADLRRQIALGAVDGIDLLGSATNGGDVSFTSRYTVDLEHPLQYIGNAMGIGIPPRFKDVVQEEAIAGLLRDSPVGVGECNVLVFLFPEQLAQGQQRPGASDVIGMHHVEVLVAHERSGFVGG